MRERRGFVPVGLEIDECGSQSWKATKNKQKLYSRTGGRVSRQYLPSLKYDLLVVTISTCC